MLDETRQRRLLLYVLPIALLLIVGLLLAFFALRDAPANAISTPTPTAETSRHSR